MNPGITPLEAVISPYGGARALCARLHSPSVAVLEVTGADNVGGAMICEAEGRLQQAIAVAHHSPFAVGGARWHNPEYEGPADTVFGGVYRREVFDRIGLFDGTGTQSRR